MALKLAVEDKVAVHVVGEIAGAAKGDKKRVDFHIYMTRLSQQQLDEAKQTAEPVVDFIKRNALGWEGQRLVLNEDGSPAEFSAEALELMLGIHLMAIWIYQSYCRDTGIKEKNS